MLRHRHDQTVRGGYVSPATVHEGFWDILPRDGCLFAGNVDIISAWRRIRQSFVPCLVVPRSTGQIEFPGRRVSSERIAHNFHARSARSVPWVISAQQSWWEHIKDLRCRGCSSAPCRASVPRGAEDSYGEGGGGSRAARRPTVTQRAPPGVRPGIFAEPWPHWSDRTLAGDGLPTLALPALAPLFPHAAGSWRKGGKDVERKRKRRRSWR